MNNNMSKGQLAYEQKRADKKGVSLDEWLASKQEPPPLHSDKEAMVLRKLERGDDTQVFFITAARYRKNKPIDSASVLFTAEPDEIQAARQEIDKQNLTMDDLNSAIASIFYANKHQNEPRLPILILAYLTHTQSYGVLTSMGIKGFTLKVLYNKKGFQVLCPNEINGTYDEIMAIAQKFEKNDKATLEICTHSIHGHVPGD